MSIMKRVGMLAAACLLWTQFLHAGTYGDFEYSESRGEITITGYIGDGGDVNIPSTINHGGVDLPVTAIGASAFSGCTSLTSVTIPDSVTSIGAWAFWDCTNLADIELSANITNLGYAVFAYCTSLTCVTIPDSVIGIGACAFWGCTSLSSIELSANITNLRYAVFAYCTSLTCVTIPDSVIGIGDYVFYHCFSLTHMTIPDSVTDIGGFAFESCTNMTKLVIGNGVTDIGRVAFGQCFSLSDLTMGSSVTNIGQEAFAFCRSLTSITIPDGVTDISAALLWGCSSLTNVTLPDGLASIGAFAFQDCTSLTSVIIPDSVTSVGYEAFVACTGLTNITIGSNVAEISRGMFALCTSLTSVTIPDSVTTIGIRAFIRCDALTKVIIGSGVIHIEETVFCCCTALTTVLFKGNAPIYDWKIFYNAQNVIVYYMHGTTGWGDTYAGRPTALWSGGDVATPAFNPDGGEHAGDSVDVTITCTTDGATIRWTTDGNDPTETSDTVDSGGSVPVPLPGTLKARAWKAGLNPSDVKSADYTAVDPEPDPEPDPDPDSDPHPQPEPDDPAPRVFISANGQPESVTVTYPDRAAVSISAHAGGYSGHGMDWFVVMVPDAGDSWEYLDEHGIWTDFPAGDLDSCRPALQAGLMDMIAPVKVFDSVLAPGGYTFYFIVDSPMDGVLNMIDGYYMYNEVRVEVEPDPDHPHPAVSIFANGESGTVEVRHGDGVTITISAYAGWETGLPVDWFVVAVPDAGPDWYCLGGDGMWTGFPAGELDLCGPALQSGFMDMITPVTVLHDARLGAGGYWFYIVVDYIQDGALNLVEGLYLSDVVRVLVQP